MAGTAALMVGVNPPVLDPAAANVGRPLPLGRELGVAHRSYPVRSRKRQEGSGISIGPGIGQSTT
jgi:hypothetical protein